MKTKLIIATLLVIVCAVGCGGSDGGSEGLDLSGSWVGNLGARITTGNSECSYFAGEYPIEWEFVRISENRFQVLREGFELGIAEVNAESSAASIPFLDLENELPDSGELCFGEDIIRVSLKDNSTMVLEYQGQSTCGRVGLCVYEGAGELSRVN